MHKQPTKLTEDQIKQLIYDYDNGNGPYNAELAQKYNVSKSTIRNALIREGVYKITRNACVAPPSAHEAKKIREHNRIMKDTLKSIIKYIEHGASPKYLKIVAYSAIEKCAKKTGIKELTDK